MGIFDVPPDKVCKGAAPAEKVLWNVQEVDTGKIVTVIAQTWIEAVKIAQTKIHSLTVQNAHAYVVFLGDEK